MPSGASPLSAAGPGSSPGQIPPNAKSFSCITCRKRKVKCDRQMPCSNCRQAQKDCSYVPPVRGKRRRTKPPREGLHAKLHRYEKLLKSYGVLPETSVVADERFSSPDTSSEDPMASSNDTSLEKNISDPYRLNNSNTVLYSEGGASRYMDSSLWSKLGSKFRRLDVDTTEPSAEAIIDGYQAQDEDVIFGAAESLDLRTNCTHQSSTDFAPLYLSEQALEKIYRAYAESFDPLLKIVHLPSLWASLQLVHQKRQDISKSMQALILSFYCAAISVMSEDQCMEALAESKDLIQHRYMVASRQALLKAEFLSTTSLVTLQAYALFLTGARAAHRADTLFIYSGVAIRLARKMGLHRDGVSLGLSHFESEIRRRLWWSLVTIDYRTSDTLAIRPSMDLACCDTRIPLNVEDEDLYPDMDADPTPRHGITKMTFGLLRCEVVHFLRKLSPGSTDVRLELLGSDEMSIAAKEKHIDELEDLIERKFLRYCDPTNPLHLMISIVGRSAICRLKLHTYSPRQATKIEPDISRPDRDIVFANASKLVEFALMIFNNPMLKQYSWHVSEGHFWTVILFLLIELGRQRIGAEVDHAWGLIWEALDKSRQIYDESAGVLFQTLRRWMVEVWDGHVNAVKTAGHAEPQEPSHIRLMRRFVNGSDKLRPKTMEQVPTGPDLQIPTSTGPIQSFGEKSYSADSYETSDTFQFSDIFSFETNANEWLQWGNLIAEEKGFATYN